MNASDARLLMAANLPPLDEEQQRLLGATIDIINGVINHQMDLRP